MDTTIKQRKLEGQSVVLEETIKTLLNSIIDLRERLSLIMLPGTSKEGALSTKVLDCVASPMTQRIQSHIDTLKEIQGIILDLENRLEV